MSTFQQGDGALGTLEAKPARKPTLRERLVVERRGELIDAAMQAFSRHGYHGTSLKEIAELAGVTDGLLVHYFGTKVNLLRVVLAERYGRLLAAIEQIVEEAPQDDPATALRWVAVRWIETLRGSGQSLVGIVLGEARHNPEVAEALAAQAPRIVVPMQRLLERFAARGLLRADHLPTAARMFHWSLLWYTYSRDVLPAGGLPEPEEWVESMVAVLLGGLATGQPLPYTGI